MKELKQITVLGMGLLGGSITLAVLRSLPKVKAVGYSHRPVTRRKARQLAVATEIANDIKQSVSEADLVILATPISAFDQVFCQIRDSLPAGCIVTDVGSTKVLPHRWAAKRLPKGVYYVGSHPIAGSEQRGVGFARADLFDQAVCVLTTTQKTNRLAAEALKKFWSQLGCSVKLTGPAEHDRVLGNISHLPHIVAAALINANNDQTLKFAGKGFMDTTRVASGPVNIWTDIFLGNTKNTAGGIDKVIAQLEKLKKAITAGDKKQIEKLLEKARLSRARLVKYKMKRKESLL